MSIGQLLDDATCAGTNHKFPFSHSPHFPPKEGNSDVTLRKTHCPAEPQSSVYWDSDQVHYRQLSPEWKQLFFF